MKKLLSIAAVAAALTLPTVSQAQVVNGGFETGTTAGWTLTGDCIFAGVSGSRHSGFLGYFDGAIGSPCTLSQNITTVVGQQYTFAFWLSSSAPVTGTSVAFTASFGGNTVFTAPVSDVFDFTLHSVDVIATSTTTAIAFTDRNDPGFFLLDDVSVTPTASTTAPEPASLALTGAGLLVVGGVARRKRAQRV